MGYEIGDYVYARVSTVDRKRVYGYGKIRAKYYDGNSSDLGFSVDVMAPSSHVFKSVHINKSDILHKITDKIRIVELKLRGL